MKTLQLPRIKWNFTALAFLLPFVGMTGVMLMSQYVPFGKYSVLYSDMFHQYYPFFLEFREALLSGDGLLWTWSVGMGMDYLGMIAYYLASPLNLLSVLLPRSMMLPYFSMLLPIKLGFAGMFFAIFLKKLFRRDDFSVTLFGCFYATCAWALGYQWNIMWMDTFALLPLVALGTVSLLKDKKFVLYTVSLFFAVLSNYYIGLFVCIFVFLIFLCYQICRWQGFKRFFLDLIRIGVFSALALGMTLFLELPAYAALQNTQSSVNAFPDKFRLNMVSKHTWEGLLEAMQKVAGNMNGGLMHTFKEGLPNLYCGVGTIMLAFLFLTCRQVKVRDKLCCVALLLFFMVSFIIRQLDYIWHGFHFPNMIPYRFSFLFSFVLLYMAYRAYLLRHRIRMWQVIAASLLSLGIVFCSEKRIDYVYLTFNLVLLSLYVTTLIFSRLRDKLPKDPEPHQKEAFLQQRRERRQLCTVALSGIMVIELVLNLVSYGLNFGGTSVVNYPKGKENTANAVSYMKQIGADSLFYRAEVTHAQTLNDGALNHYYGISAFSSSAYVNVTEFMQALGYGAKNTYNRYCFEESSPVANLFLNLRYMIERDGNVEENAYFDSVETFGNVTLLENNAYLPLGFLANTELKDIDFLVSGNRFTFQNDLLFAASGVADVWKTMRSSCLTITNTDTITPLGVTPGRGTCSYASSGSSGKVTFTYTIEEEGFFCIDLTLTKKNSYVVRKNGERLYSETYSLPQMIAVSDVMPGDVIELVFTCKANESGTIIVKHGLLDAQLFRQAHSVLEASTWNLTEFSTSRISGTIQCNRDGLLYTSIPQTGNWYATVDGVPVETVKVGDAMAGLLLTEGTHTVTFTYRNDAFRLGCLLSLISAGAFLTIWILVYKPYNKFRINR